MPAPRRARRHLAANLAASVRFEIVLTGEDVARWTSLAAREDLTLPELVRASVDLAIARGSTR